MLNLSHPIAGCMITCLNPKASNCLFQISSSSFCLAQPVSLSSTHKSQWLHLLGRCKQPSAVDKGGHGRSWDPYQSLAIGHWIAYSTSPNQSYYWTMLDTPLRGSRVIEATTPMRAHYMHSQNTTKYGLCFIFERAGVTCTVLASREFERQQNDVDGFLNWMGEPKLNDSLNSF